MPPGPTNGRTLTTAQHSSTAYSPPTLLHPSHSLHTLNTSLVVHRFPPLLSSRRSYPPHPPQSLPFLHTSEELPGSVHRKMVARIRCTGPSLVILVCHLLEFCSFEVNLRCHLVLLGQCLTVGLCGAGGTGWRGPAISRTVTQLLHCPQPSSRSITPSSDLLLWCSGCIHTRSTKITPPPGPHTLMHHLSNSTSPPMY